MASVSPARLIGWSAAIIAATIAAVCILTVIGVSYEVLRG